MTTNVTNVTETPQNQGDHVVRAITDDGCFRVIAARTTDTVRGAIAAQEATGPAARALAELITGAILVREAMAPRLRVQGVLKLGAGGSLIADSHPDGTSRGLVQLGGRTFDWKGGALLQMMRTLPSGAIHQGVVEAPAQAQANGRVSAALMAYMQESEQIVTTIAAASIDAEGDSPAIAGGFLVQLLPEVERGPLMVMTERLAEFMDLAAVLRGVGATPDGLIGEILYGMPFTRLEESNLSFGCQCSEERVMGSLSTLPKEDVEDLLKPGEVLEIKCDYCARTFAIPPALLQALLTPS
jgi:molecular chaperone Hsp33